jgi:hypothetical protein
MAKHTPAPWIVTPTKWQDLETFEISSESAPAWIAQVLRDRGTVYGPRPVSEGEANAKLIAAAPYLLEALQDLYQTVIDGEDACEALIKAERVLESATLTQTA